MQAPGISWSERHDGEKPSAPKTSRNFKLVRNMTAIYIIALIFVGGLSIASHYLLDKAIQAEADTALQINISGRQRMLSQRIALLSHQLAEGNESSRLRLAKTIEEMREAHEALMAGSLNGRTLAVSSAAHDLYHSGPAPLNSRVERFLSEAERVMTSPRIGQRKAAADLVLDAAMGPLLNRLNDAVLLYQQEAYRRIEAVRRMHRSVLLLLQFTLLVEALLIFRPMVSTLRDYMNKLYDSASIDALTGLANRGFFIRSCARELLLAARNKESVAVMMIDIDHFKKINDQYGHDVGDRCLKHFSKVMRETLRESDLIGRLGGEEFAVILRDCDRIGAMSLYERIRATLLTQKDKAVPRYTVSCGITIALKDETIEAALKRADEQLYEAKLTGRNKACVTKPAQKKPVKNQNENKVAQMPQPAKA